MARDFVLPIRSTGVILQQIARQTDAAGARMRAFLASGDLMGDDEITEYLFAALPPHGGWLVDGYPRTVEQARRLDARLDDAAATLDIAVFLEIGKEAVRQRVLDRWVHPASGRVYSYAFQPPLLRGLDDATGEALVQRLDDNFDVFDKRWDNYEIHRQSLLDYYRHRGIATVISGSTSPHLYAQLRPALEQLAATRHHPDDNLLIS